MIKLYGIAVSNYYNMVKQSLLEKGAEFECVDAPPSQDSEYLSKSPMGKVPCIETDGGFLSETDVILDYLEDTIPTPALYPANPFKRAKAKELIRICELDIELAARRHYAHLFFKEERNDAAVAEVKPVIKKGLQAVTELASFEPYIAGPDFTYADIVAYHCFRYPNNVTQAIYDWDIVASVPGLQAWRDLVASRNATQEVDAAQQQAIEAMMAA